MGFARAQPILRIGIKLLKIKLRKGVRIGCAFLKVFLKLRPVRKPKIHILMPGCPELARWPPWSAPLC